MAIHVKKELTEGNNIRRSLMGYKFFDYIKAREIHMQMKAAGFTKVGSTKQLYKTAHSRIKTGKKVMRQFHKCELIY